MTAATTAHRSPLLTLRGLPSLAVVGAKLFLREPAAAFFTLAFPLILLFVFGSAFGNDPDPDMYGGKWGAVDVMVQGHIGLIIGTIVFIGMPVSISSYRQYGILKRLRATPVTAMIVILAQLIVNLAMFVGGVVLLLIAGKLVFDLRMPVSMPGFLLASLLSFLSFAAVGFVLASIFPTARTAQAVGSAICFPQMFLSGAAFPREMFPDTMKRVTEFLPMTQINILVTQMWQDGTWNRTAVLVLVIIGGVAAVVAARVFRWE